TAPPTSAAYTLSLHDALPIWPGLRTPPSCRAPPASKSGCWESTAPKNPMSPDQVDLAAVTHYGQRRASWDRDSARAPVVGRGTRSEEHTSELQSRENLVCRLL